MAPPRLEHMESKPICVRCTTTSGAACNANADSGIRKLGRSSPVLVPHAGAVSLPADAEL